MITRYVNRGSTAGGDGTTNATAGANRAYASLSEFETNEQGSMSDNYTVYCSRNGGAEDGAVVFAGWTYNGYTVTIVGECDGGMKHDSSCYVIYSANDTIRVSQSNFNLDIEKLQVRCGPDTNDRVIEIDSAAYSGIIINIKNSSFTTDASPAADAGKLYDANTTNSIFVNNCVFYSAGTSCENSGRFRNCVFDGNTRAVRGANTVVNCIFRNNGTDFYSGTPTTATNNLTNKATLGGTVNVVNATVSFVSSTNYRLVNRILGGKGPAIDSLVLTTDVDGNTRSGNACCLGLNEVADGAQYTDDFNRANESPLTSPWATTDGNGIQITSNQVRTVGGDSVSYLADLNFDDSQSAQLTFNAISNYDWMGPAVRFDGSGNGYVAYYASGDSRVYIARYASGTPTTILTLLSTTFSVSDTIKVSIGGGVISVLKNGSPICGVYDANYSSGKPGIFGGSDNANATYSDDFVATGYIASSSIVNKISNHGLYFGLFRGLNK